MPEALRTVLSGLSTLVGPMYGELSLKAKQLIDDSLVSHMHISRYFSLISPLLQSFVYLYVFLAMSVDHYADFLFFISYFIVFVYLSVLTLTLSLSSISRFLLSKLV